MRLTLSYIWAVPLAGDRRGVTVDMPDYVYIILDKMIVRE